MTCAGRTSALRARLRRPRLPGLRAFLSRRRPFDLGELRRSLRGVQPLREAVQLLAPRQDITELGGGVPDAMVRDPSLREVIGPDLLGALRRADHRPSRRRLLRLLLVEGLLV